MLGRCTEGGRERGAEPSGVLGLGLGSGWLERIRSSASRFRGAAITPAENSGSVYFVPTFAMQSAGYLSFVRVRGPVRGLTSFPGHSSNTRGPTGAGGDLAPAPAAAGGCSCTSPAPMLFALPQLSLLHCVRIRLPTFAAITLRRQSLGAWSNDYATGRS